MASDKIFKNCIFKTYFTILWYSFATNWNHLNNFARGWPTNYSSSWAKQFWRRSHLKNFNSNFWPLGHGKFKPHRHILDNFGRGPLDAVIYQLWALWIQRRFLKSALSKPTSWPCDLLMQPIRTVWTTLEEDHLRIIAVKFGQKKIAQFQSGRCLREKVDGWRRMTDKGRSQ